MTVVRYRRVKTRRIHFVVNFDFHSNHELPFYRPKAMGYLLLLLRVKQSIYGLPGFAWFHKIGRMLAGCVGSYPTKSLVSLAHTFSWSPLVASGR